MGFVYKENNVFDEALDRIRMIYDHHDEVIVNMSGGKDSTVVFNLALMVAKEKNRLPVKLYWLDQEAEWQHTVDYVEKLMRMPEVKPYWWQVPFAFPNNLSTTEKTLWIFDENEEEKWVHPKSDIAITESPIDTTKMDRDKAFYVLIDRLHEYCLEDSTKECAVLTGMRIAESQGRRLAITTGKAKFMGETWCAEKAKGARYRVFWPIYDFTNDDIWTAIAKNNWEYNKVYDFMYQWGTPKLKMRVSALIHETSWAAIEMLQEFEPETYNRFVARVAGTSPMNHSMDYGEVIPKDLPFMFKDWKEYRDYLLENLIEHELHDHYRKEWAKQDSDDWYRLHVAEVILNDTCGTLNQNQKTSMDLKKNTESGKHFKRDFQEFLKAKKEAANGD